MSIFNYSKLKRDQENYIIAEVGVNHECNIKIAKKLILLAKKGGAHAVKFQTYKYSSIKIFKHIGIQKEKQSHN